MLTLAIPGPLDAADATPLMPSGGLATETSEACVASLYREPADLEPCVLAIESAPDADLAQQTDKARLQSALALQYARRGDLAQARLNIDNALHRAPRDWVVRAHEGNIFIYESEFEAALAAIEDALQAAPEPPPALYLNRSLALRALGRYDAAQADFQQYTSQTPGGIPPND